MPFHGTFDILNLFLRKSRISIVDIALHLCCHDICPNDTAMKGFFIRSTKVTPSVYFNPQKGLLDLRGKSSPENPLAFYNHIFENLDKFAESEFEKLTTNAAFEYFNTSSSKCLFGLFKKIAAIEEKGKKIVINWYYEEGDDDMQEAGEDLSSFFDFEFIYHEIPEICVLGEENKLAS